MKLIEYLKDKLLFIITNIILFFIIATIMTLSRVSFIIIFLVFLIWFVPITSYILIEFITHKRYYNELIDTNESLDKKYLISEVIKEPQFIEGKIVHNILKDSNRNMQEHVKLYKNMQNEYREYIETWVHEVKTPIASMMLIAENYEDDIPKTMKYEIKKVENYIEQVLYYSKSNEVGSDYIIKEFNLEKVVKKVIKRNSNDFINKKIRIEIDGINEKVYSDSKWTEFILNQIIGNSLKYSKCEYGIISIYTKKNKNNIVLCIEDNGVGISEKDINRVFEKGFTGENGRVFGKSTGIGLYLCKKLCNKLGLGIKLESIKNKGTKVSIVFPLDKKYTYSDN